MSCLMDGDTPIEFFCDTLEQEMIESKHRFNIWLCGRRYGKSACLRIRRAIIALNAQPGQMVWYVAPQYARAFKEYEIMMSDVEFRNNFVKRKRTQPYPAIYLNNGVEISFRSFERPDNLLGEGLVECQCDESQKIPESDFWRVLYPMVMDQGGSIVLAGTVRGKNWIWALHEEALKGNTNYKSYIRRTDQGPSFQDEIGRANLQIFRSSMPEDQAKQELDCIPILEQDSVFKHLDEAIVNTVPESVPLPGKRYILSLDIGRVRDPCCVMIGDQFGNVVYVEHFPLGQKHTLSAKRAGELAAIWRCFHSAVVDVTGGGTGGHANYDEFVKEYRAVLPNMRDFIWSPAHVEQQVNHTVLAVEKGKLKIPQQFKLLIQQMRDYRYYFSGYHIRYGACKGSHDEGPACLVMYNCALKSNWFSSTGSSLKSVLQL